MADTEKMNEPKRFASLSSSLLARKGAAKPAMRRQSISFPLSGDVPVSDQHEDLGWNDMGYDTNPDHQLADNIDQVTSVHHVLPAYEPSPTVPEVRRQQDELAAKLNASRLDSGSVDGSEYLNDHVVSQPAASLDSPQETAQHGSVSKAAVAVQPVALPYETRPPVRSRTRRAKVAFTLRLDADRHYKLKLATAMNNVSAQQLVTKAVDEYLRKIPELDDLVMRVPARRAV